MTAVVGCISQFGPIFTTSFEKLTGRSKCGSYNLYTLFVTPSVLTELLGIDLAKIDLTRFIPTSQTIRVLMNRAWFLFRSAKTTNIIQQE